MSHPPEEQALSQSPPILMQNPPETLTEVENVAGGQEHVANMQTPKSRSEPTVSALQPDLESGEQHSSAAPTTESLLGIFYRPPVKMLSTLLLGLGAAVALHLYYTSLSGTLVGNADSQQTALRISTSLAFTTQICLVNSVYIAFVQYMWEGLKRNVLSFKGIDAAFSATSDPLSFFNGEMRSKLKLVSFLALIAWCIPISTLITPATLNIYTLMQTETKLMNVSMLDISQAGPYERYAHAVNETRVGSQQYLGPRSIITRLAMATAATGQILPLAPPSANATYRQSFYAPYTQCQSASAAVAAQINAMADRSRLDLDPATKQVSLDYLAVVPALSSLNDSSLLDVQIANLSSFDGASYASNQLWLYFTRYQASQNFTRAPEAYYLTCELYNASYQVEFSWSNGIQNVTILNLDVLNPVYYPVNASTSADSEEDMAYSAVMWALSSQLTGSIGFYNATDNTAETTYADRTYSMITTNIAQTVLLGSSDLNSHFIENHLLGYSNGSTLFSDQRLQDMAFARNRSLEVLIPELSANITLSLISNPLLAPRVPTNVSITSPANVYSYQSRNVLIAYCLAGAFALLANVLGLYAYNSSRVSHDTSFSTIVCTTRGVHFSDLGVHERLGELPLDPLIAVAKLEFHERGFKRFGFGAARAVG